MTAGGIGKTELGARAPVGKGWRRLLRGSPLALTAGILMGAVVATGVSWASIPDATGQIHGCYKAAGKTTHALSVIDSAATSACPKGMLPLNWNTGALIYQKTVDFAGPYTGGQTVATFTVPAGLMCAQATATAYTTGTTGQFLELAFQTGTAAYGQLVLRILANQDNLHMALVPYFGEGCHQVPAGTFSYAGNAESGIYPTTTDNNDQGNISVQVYSQ